MRTTTKMDENRGEHITEKEDVQEYKQQKKRKKIQIVFFLLPHSFYNFVYVCRYNSIPIIHIYNFSTCFKIK